MASKRSSSLLAALLLAGCAVGPNFKQPSAPAGAGYTPEPLSQATVSAPGAVGQAQKFVQGKDISSRWWELFQSPPLNDLVDRALKANPTIAAAQASLKVARENMLAQGGSLLHCRLRYFDSVRRRAGIPDDVAALVDGMTGDRVTVTLVNVNQTEPSLVTVQAGAYGEHEVISVSNGDQTQIVNDPSFHVRLGPGAGARLMVKMKRFANEPTLSFPWDRA